MFEKVNKAYEYLCSSKKATDGPDPRNIVLILKAQCILFSRYREGKKILDLFFLHQDSCHLLCYLLMYEGDSISNQPDLFLSDGHNQDWSPY